MAAPGQVPAERAPRRRYLDWLRGLAVVIMIGAHILDSWTRLGDRQLLLYKWSMILGGFGAPLFLLLAGVAVPLSAGSKFRRTGHASGASRAVVRRGLEVFGLAFLFRVQAWAVSWGSPRSLLKVDILNIMGPGIMAAAALWGLFRSSRARAIAFVAAALAMSLFTPAIRTTGILDFLPDAIEAYIRPRPGYTTFAIFPWAGFLFAGAFLGVLLDDARTGQAEKTVNFRFGVTGMLLAVGAYVASFLPSLYAESQFWTSSPSFFLLRAGILMALVSLVYGVKSGVSRETFSPFEQLGRTSLFIYWIHVEMIYGLIAKPLHKALSLGQSLTACLIFGLFMLVCSLLKDRVVAWWRARSQPTMKNVPPAI